MKVTIDLWLDGYETEEEMNAACLDLIQMQLNTSGSSVKIINQSNDWVNNVDWNTRRGELILQVEEILTEPLCPTAKLYWENTKEVLYQCHADSIEEAVQKAHMWGAKNFPEKEKNDET